MSSTLKTIPIHYSIKDLFNKDEWDSIEEEFSCPICYELIYKQEWYQCGNGHPCCGGCWSAIVSSNGSKQCPLCNIPVQSMTNSLSRCRVFEKSFQNKKVSCPYSFGEGIKLVINSNKLVRDVENGCKEIIKVEQLEDHKLNCNSRFVKCNNDGCNQVVRYKQYQQHQNQCDQSTVECDLCKIKVKRSLLPSHQYDCPPRELYKQSSLELFNLELPDLDEECPHTIIRCRFQAYGCNAQFKRSELSNHLQQINHTEFMIKLINQQSQQLNLQAIKLEQQSNQIGQLQQSNIKYSKELEQFKKELRSSDNMVNDFLCSFNKSQSVSNSFTPYKNIWVITDFLQKTGAESKPSIKSPLIDVGPFQFKLSTVFKNNLQRFHLYAEGSTQGKLKVNYSLKLINWRDSSKSIVVNVQYDMELNSGMAWSYPFEGAKYSIDKGYVFQDGSVHIEFTINILRNPIQS